jgi:hypothetical protein
MLTGNSLILERQVSRMLVTMLNGPEGRQRVGGEPGGKREQGTSPA